MFDRRRYEANQEWLNGVDWRAMKKHEIKMGIADPVYVAHREGECDYCEYRAYRNPYPPGRRHNAYHRGYHTADPGGEWHGNNE